MDHPTLLMISFNRVFPVQRLVGRVLVLFIREWPLVVEVVGRVGGQFVHWFPLVVAAIVLILRNGRSTDPATTFPVVTVSKQKWDDTQKKEFGTPHQS